MKLTDEQSKVLEWLFDHNGEGTLDRHSRVCAGGETQPRASWPVWLRLVALGLVEGSNARLRLTAAGRMKAAQIDGDARERKVETKLIGSPEERTSSPPDLASLDEDPG